MRSLGRLPWKAREKETAHGGADATAFEPVHQLHDRLTQGEITPVDIVEGYLDRIARYDASSTRTSMFTPTRPGPAAHAAAAAMASGHRIGPFHGIPVR